MPLPRCQPLARAEEGINRETLHKVALSENGNRDVAIHFIVIKFEEASDIVFV